MASIYIQQSSAALDILHSISGTAQYQRRVAAIRAYSRLLMRIRSINTRTGLITSEEPLAGRWLYCKMPMTIALICQSDDMTVQREQHGASAAAKQDAAMSAPIRTLRRFSNTTAPTPSTSLIAHSAEQSQQQQHREPRRCCPRKRLSLPFRRTAQVVASTITDVDVYYGSLTGTSARLAALLAKDIAARGVNTTLQSLGSFDAQCFVAPDKLASTHASVFVVSTHFAGSASPSAELFYDWLKAASSSSSSSGGVTTHVAHCSILGKALASMDLNAPDYTTDTATNTTTATTSTVRTQDNTSPTPPVGSSPLRFLVNWGRDLGRKRLRDRARSRLEGLQYAVLGVGSSEYLTFNAMGKFVDARLHILGGSRLSPLGLGDVSGNVEAEFIRWKVGFLQQLPVIPHNIRLLAFENDLLLMEPQQKAQQQRFRTSSLSRSAQQYRQQDDESSEAATIKSMVMDRYNKPVRLRFRCRVITAPVASSRRSSVSAQHKQLLVTESSMATKHSLHTRRPNVSLQSIQLLQLPLQQTTANGDDNEQGTSQLEAPRSQVALVRIALLDPDMKFEAADTFGYLPHNSTENVERIAENLGFDLDTWIELYFDRHLHGQQQNQLPYLTPCTVRTALTEFLELNTVTREFMRVASGFASNDSERDLLEQLASTDGSAAFTDQFVKQNKGILQLLDLAPSLKIPFEVFVNITPVIKPRLYSIASSPQCHRSREIELAVNLGRPDKKQGVSVTYFRKLMLAQLSNSNNSRSSGVMLRAFIVRSLFKVPSDMASPMIMIANSTGIAPMRALLQHRKLEYDKLNSDRKPPRNLLFYGCRDASSILFDDELRALEQEGFLTLRLALSAGEYDSGGPEKKPRQYVQDIVARHVNEIAELTSSSSDARIFVSGTFAMVRSVRQVFQSYSSLPNEEEAHGKHWFDEIVRGQRFVQDAF